MVDGPSRRRLPAAAAPSGRRRSAHGAVAAAAAAPAAEGYGAQTTKKRRRRGNAQPPADSSPHPLALLGPWSQYRPASCEASSQRTGLCGALLFSSHDVRLFSAPPDALNAGWDAELHSFELTRAAEAAVCGPLAAAALRLAARSTGIRVSNRGGAWHSRPAFLRHCESGGGDAATRAAARLAREAVLRAGAAAAGCGAPPPLTHAWANVASGGAGHHGLHDHDGALLSGVLYLSVPAPPGGCSATGGELLLRTATSAPADAAGAAAGSWCEFAGVTPLRGLLLLFPGWLPHAVLPMPAAAPGSERVSLSFNLGRVG